MSYKMISLLLAVGALLLLQACTSEPKKRFPQASEAGRRACIEEVQANYAPQGRVEAMKRCLQTIDQRLALEKKPPVDETTHLPDPGSTTDSNLPSAKERYLFCRLHQQEIQAAERIRQAKQSIWMSASGRGSHDGQAFDLAKDDYADAVANIERMIPPEYRNGLPLIPDAILAYTTCEGDVFLSDSD